jgi:hypothetical protein
VKEKEKEVGSIEYRLLPPYYKYYITPFYYFIPMQEREWRPRDNQLLQLAK